MLLVQVTNQLKKIKLNNLDKKQKSLKLATVALLLGVSAMILSCSKNEDAISGAESQVVNNESTQDAQQDEVDDMSTNALGNTDSPTGGRVEAPFFFNDHRLSCAIITRDTAAFKTRGSGKITIDFGSGCTDKHGNVRAGKIIITWSGGRWFMPGAVYIITFSGYSINDVKFSDNDIRTVTNVSTMDSSLTFTIVASHLLTWPDNTTATREVHKTKQWVRSSNIVDDKIIVSQTSPTTPAANGINRRAISYSVEITVPLEYLRSCAISNKVFKPVKGVKVITYDNGKVITIDFGDGTCDKKYTISINGRTKTMDAKNDSSAD